MAVGAGIGAGAAVSGAEEVLPCDGVVVIGGAPSWASPGSIGIMALNSLVTKNYNKQNQRRRYILVCAPLTNITKHEPNKTIFRLLVLYDRKKTYKTYLASKVCETFMSRLEPCPFTQSM